MNTDSERHKTNNIWKNINYVNVHLKQTGSKKEALNISLNVCDLQCPYI